MGLFDLLHGFVNWILIWLKLLQKRQVGWKTLNRKTNKLEREQQPLLKKLKLIVLFNPLLEWIDTTHAMRLYIHKKNARAGVEEGKPRSHDQIKSFIDFYHINMSDFEPSTPEKYSTFEDFFVRKHKPGSRPIVEPSNPRKATAVADSRVVTYDTVAESKKLWIKGTDFNITNLVMDKNIGKRFDNGAVASFRLSPQDYHRYHSPVSGTIKEYRALPGEYYQVDEQALQSKVNILTSNARDYLLIDTDEFGEVLFVAIGATNVGSVRIHDQWQQPVARVNKGDELGLFQFGGSSIIVAFQAGRIRFDADLRDYSQRSIQVSVEVGMSLGDATSPKTDNGKENGQGQGTGSAHVAEDTEKLPSGDEAKSVTENHPGDVSYADAVKDTETSST